MPFSTVFQLFCSGQCTFPCFPEATAAYFQTVDSGERIEATIINPLRDHWLSWGSNQRPVLKS